MKTYNTNRDSFNINKSIYPKSKNNQNIRVNKNKNNIK